MNISSEEYIPIMDSLAQTSDCLVRTRAVHSGVHSSKKLPLPSHQPVPRQADTLAHPAPPLVPAPYWHRLAGRHPPLWLHFHRALLCIHVPLELQGALLWLQPGVVCTWKFEISVFVSARALTTPAPGPLCWVVACREPEGRALDHSVDFVDCRTPCVCARCAGGTGAWEWVH